MARALENKSRELGQERIKAGRRAVLDREVIEDVSKMMFKLKLEKLGASHAECGERRTVRASHVASRWLALHLLCALRGPINQILSYIHQFNTSTSSPCALGLEAVLTSGRLYSSLLSELDVPGLPAKQGSPKPGSMAEGLGSPRYTAICSGPLHHVGIFKPLPRWRVGLNGSGR